MSAHHPSQLTLTRTFRLAATAVHSDQLGRNGLVGPAADWGVAAIGELEIEVAGLPAASGYLVDITVLDAALRESAVGRFRRAVELEGTTGQPADITALLSEIVAATVPLVTPEIVRLTYRPTPFRSVTFMPRSSLSASAAAILTETFEFAAAHRLHLAELGDEENRRLFGKCNNPNGHGHNYRIEVACEVGPSAPPIGFGAIQELVQREVMRRFDHKHLNLDCPEFAALNPSVENIARVCHELLAPGAARLGARLAYVRVWETDKTSCRYPA